MLEILLAAREQPQDRALHAGRTERLVDADGEPVELVVVAFRR